MLVSLSPTGVAPALFSVSPLVALPPLPGTPAAPAPDAGTWPFPLSVS